MQVHQESDPSRTDGRELWLACERTGVSMGGRAHSLIFLCSADQGVLHVRKLLRECLLGYVLDGQPTMILHVSFPVENRDETRRDDAPSVGQPDKR